MLATNIAETSLTIPGIKHVVDSCRVKAKVHQAKAGLDLLKVRFFFQACHTLYRIENNPHCFIKELKNLITNAEIKN